MLILLAAHDAGEAMMMMMMMMMMTTTTTTMMVSVMIMITMVAIVAWLRKSPVPSPKVSIHPSINKFVSRMQVQPYRGIKNLNLF